MGDAIGYLLVIVVLVFVYKLMKQGWTESTKSDGADRKRWHDQSSERQDEGNDAQHNDQWRTPEYRIEYVDADGVITTREITPASDKGTKYSLRAFCFLRNDWRTFLLERMSKVWRLGGAEILTGEELYYDMRGKLEEFRSKQADMRAKEGAYWARQHEKMQKEANANRPELVECWETFGDALLLMTYFGKADNRFLKSEKDLIRSFLKERDQSEDVVEDMIKRLEKQEMVSLKEIDKLLSRISKEAGDSMRHELVGICRQIVVADKKEHEDETILLRRMERVLAVQMAVSDLHEQHERAARGLSI